jgi:hypothetical protein
MYVPWAVAPTAAVRARKAAVIILEVAGLGILTIWYLDRFQKEDNRVCLIKKLRTLLLI